ncbi:MAG: glycogen-binding domain-containing protein [Gemmatimonadota bacterium]
MPRIAASGVVSLLLLAIAADVHAQQWNVDAQVGRIRSTLDPGIEAPSVALGLRYTGSVSGLSLNGGVPVQDDEPFWGSFSGWTRLAARSGDFVAGLDVSGTGLVLRDRASQASDGPLPGPLDPVGEPATTRAGHIFAAQALPLIGWEGELLQVHARAGFAHHATRQGGQRRDRTVRLADVQLGLTPHRSLAIMPVIRRFQPEDEPAATYGGMSAVFVHAGLSVWGGAGWFMDVDEAASSWSAGTSIAVGDRLNVKAGVRRDGFDPLYLNPPQTSWSAGVSLLVGGRAVLPAAPVPAKYEVGRATIALPASQSRTAPSIAGDFNEWVPHAMQLDGATWTYTVAVEPGVYNYSFVSDSGEWFVPEDVPGRKDDGMGGHVAVLVVQ